MVPSVGSIRWLMENVPAELADSFRNHSLVLLSKRLDLSYSNGSSTRPNWDFSLARWAFSNSWFLSRSSSTCCMVGLFRMAISRAFSISNSTWARSPLTPNVNISKSHKYLYLKNGFVDLIIICFIIIFLPISPHRRITRLPLVLFDNSIFAVSPGKWNAPILFQPSSGFLSVKSTSSEPSLEDMV